MQTKVDHLNSVGKGLGLRINVKKAKVMRLTSQTRNILGENIMENVGNSIDLGATVSTTGGTEQDIRARLGKVKATFLKLNKIWWRVETKKMQTFKSNMMAVLLNSCETCHITKADGNKLDTFEESSRYIGQ